MKCLQKPEEVWLPVFQAVNYNILKFFSQEGVQKGEYVQGQCSHLHPQSPICRGSILITKKADKVSHLYFLVFHCNFKYEAQRYVSANQTTREVKENTESHLNLRGPQLTSDTETFHRKLISAN